ncbi:MAG: DUF4097 family beta strand repeat-containing protein [Bacteroidota bacterium]
MKRTALIILLAVSLLPAETKEFKKSISADKARKVEMHGFNGSEIAVKTWNKNEVFVNVSVDYSLSDREQESEKLQQYDIVLEQSGDRIEVRFKEPKNVNEGFSFKHFFRSLFSTTYSQLTVTGEIYLPANTDLTSDMRYGTYSVAGVAGDLTLTGVSNMLTVKNCPSVKKIENNYGTTTVLQCGGSLAFTGESTTLVVEDFKGAVNANANYSNVTLSRISNDVSVTCSSGRVTGDSIGGNLSVDASYSVIDMTNIKGNATVASQSGTIRVKNANGATITAPYSNISLATVNDSGSPVSVRNTSGKTEITDVTRDVQIDDSYSTIALTNIRGNVSVSGTGLTFRGKKIIGNFSIKNEYGDIRVDELSASTVEVKNRSNSVDISLLTKPSKIDITNEYGPVSISFPEYSGEVRLKASYGSIRTNLPVEVEEMGGGAIAIGKVGNGSSTLNIKTVSGTIDVQQKK